jgi:hypothetical protein
MPTSKKCISPQQQLIMLLLINNDYVDFSTQKFYRCRRTFNKAMNRLVNCGWLKRKMIRLNNRYANQYTITIEGNIIAKKVFGVYNES